ncbi:hypothetical protein [Streptomyces sp. NBC_00425]|uniref:hypothetical protein n=1 Tax=Streptomyces sp. NBC_00425 TaxID=2975740 RepID=UPI002E1A306A
MSARTTLHCETVHGYSACAASLITDGFDAAEARQIGAAHGWRHSGGKDYCPGCSGSRMRPRVIVAVPEAKTLEGRPDHRLQEAEALLSARLNAATGGTWRTGRTPEPLPHLPGVEFVTGGHHGSECVARTGQAGNEQAAADAAYIATLDPDVGRAITAVLHEARESVSQEHGLVEDSLAQAAVDLADALLRRRDPAVIG